MTDLGTKPRSGRLLDPEAYNELIQQYIDVGHRLYKVSEDLCEARGVQLADHSRAHVSLMRVPYAPYYDTSFILKFFKTASRSQAPREQVELEAGSLHHAGEAFRRNNVGRAPRIYAVRSAHNLIAMERIHGKGYRDSDPEWWPKERMVKFVRQMAVFRLAIMTQVQNQLGVPRHAPHEGRVGPYCSHVWWDHEKYRFWNVMDRGPFPNRHEMILASLRRELLLAEWMSENGRPLSRRSHFPTWADTIFYLERAIENIDREPRPTRPEFFSLNHNDLALGFNIMMRGGKLAAFIDWETASYDPLTICIVDLADETDYDPRVWRENAGPNGENFHVLPYRLEADPTEGRMTYATSVGAERKPFPDWELIENNGGPLCEEDFCGDDCPEDLGSGDDESIVDAVEMHCDSDVDAEERCLAPQAGPGQSPLHPFLRGTEVPHLGIDWYCPSVYALMKEFIHHHRGAGLGPNGEWGKLPEEYSRPLAEWDDPLFWRVTQAHFEGRHNQVIDEDRIDVAVPLAKARKMKKKKIAGPPRPRRVPTLLNAWDDTAAGRGEEENSPTKSPVSSSDGFADWTRKLSPRRKRSIKSPIHRRVGPSRDPIPLTTLPGEPDPAREKGRAEADVQPTGDDDDERVKSVREAVLARVMERLRDRIDSGGELL